MKWHPDDSSLPFLSLLIEISCKSFLDLSASHHIWASIRIHLRNPLDPLCSNSLKLMLMSESQAVHAASNWPSLSLLTVAPPMAFICSTWGNPSCTTTTGSGRRWCVTRRTSVVNGQGLVEGGALRRGWQRLRSPAGGRLGRPYRTAGI